jgi:FKBP-type peptidyl-prolyl cis-trans isomerase (trigger factor)
LKLNDDCIKLDRFRTIINKRKAVLSSAVLFLIVFGIAALITIKADNSGHPLPIDENVELMLEYMEFNDCEILSIGKYVGVSHEKVEYSVSDYDVDAYITGVLSNYDEQIVITDRTTIAEGDIAVVNYNLSYNGEIIKSKKSEIINVGSGYFNYDFEEKLIGQEIGEVIQFEWLVPDIPSVYGDYEEFVNKYIQVEAYIQYAYYIKPCELSDSFVQSEFGYTNIDAYYNYVRELLEQQTEKAAENKEKENAFDGIMNNSTFKLDEKGISANTESYLNTYLL